MKGTYSQLLGPKQTQVMAKPSVEPDSLPNAVSRSAVVSQENIFPPQNLAESPTEPTAAVIYDQQTELEQPGRTEKRTEVRSEKRSVPLPFKRRTKRYSFEFYEDQVFTVKKMV